jgi:hypothetical protein
MAYLPWRRTAVDADDRPTQYRTNGPVSGLSVTVVLDVVYYPDNDPDYPGLIDTKTFTISGPDDGSQDIEMVVTMLYDVNGNKTGEDISVDGNPVTYTP